MKLTRRHLTGCMIATPGFILNGCASAPSTGRSNHDLSSQSASGAASRDPLIDLIRLRGDPVQDVWLWFEGRVYGRTPDTVIKPIFGFTSILRVRYDEVDNRTVRFSQRESAHYTDLNTGEPVGEFYNPYTDSMNIAVGYVSPLFSYQLRPVGTWSLRSQKQIGHLDPAIESDQTHVWTTEYRANEFPASISAEEFPNAVLTPTRKSADVATYRVLKDDFDRVGAFVPATTDVVADTPWPLWMFMGSRPGNVVWIGHGAKVLKAADLPADLRRRVELVHPGFLEDPWELDASQYSTAYQMRALRAAGRI